MMTETKRPTNQAAEEILGLYFPVLDNGFISLCDYMGTDQCIERAARVSYGGGGTRQVSQTRTLIRYLKRHAHTSPYEMIEVKLHCCMPIFVARQWIRTRTASVNEMSGRYSLMPMLFYSPTSEQFKAQSTDNKQGRGGTLDSNKYAIAIERWNNLRVENRQLYEDLTISDVARELARIDLPLSTYTQWYWKIDLHNLLRFLTLRTDPHAQWETRQYANVMAGMVKRIAPLSYEAWIDYDVCGEKFSRIEMETLRHAIDNGTKITGLLPLVENGWTKREAEEFEEKLTPKPVPDFELDLSTVKSPEYFEARFAAAVPKIDRNSVKHE